jgi:hypothetical protein
MNEGTLSSLANRRESVHGALIAALSRSRRFIFTAAAEYEVKLRLATTTQAYPGVGAL